MSINFDKTLQNYGQKLSVRIQDEHRKTDVKIALQMLINADPTPNKKYTRWIILTYIKGGINYLEDMDRVKEYLTVFEQHKAKLSIKDIGQIESLDQLREVIAPYISREVIDANEYNKVKDQIEVNYYGPEGKILVPKTEMASCYLGRNTEWCTAWGNHKKFGFSYEGNHPTKTNQFDYYNKDGRLYVILPNDGSEYQFHLKSGQLMDKNDNDVNFNEFKKKYPWVFDNIKFNENEQLAVQQNGFSIRYIKNPSEAVQLAAVQQNGYAIEYIKNPSEAVQLLAVKRNGNAIRYIENPSEDVQLAAVKQDGDAIRYIKNPSEAVQLLAVKRNGYVIRDIENPSEAVQLLAVKRNGYVIGDIENPSEAVQLAAVRKNGLVIRYIKNPTEKVRQLAR